MKVIISFCLSFLIGFGLYIGFFYVLESRGITQPTYVSPISNKQLFSLSAPPSDSLKGEVASISGQVEWESRIATQSSPIYKPQQILQGESINTKDNGRAVVKFSDQDTVLISSKTSLNFIQTLPQNMLIEQTQGSAEYVTSDSLPLTIRSLHIIIQNKNADMLLTTDKDNKVVYATVRKGEITAAFNDDNNTSNVIPISEGKELIFDDDSLTYRIIRNYLKYSDLK